MISILLTGVGAALAIDCDDCLSLVNRLVCQSCWFSCAVNTTDVSRTERHLRSNLFGQQSSITAIVKALRRHNSHPVKPLVLHFAGDNGVGKTLCSKLIAQSRSTLALRGNESSPDESIDGYLYMRGESYRERDAAFVRAFREDIRRRIANFLYKCPDALIVLDEVEKIHKTTMSVFLEFIDNTVPFVDYNGTHVSTARAVFIFISDFGTASSSVAMSDAQLRDAVEQASLGVWESRKQVDLVSDIVPFRTLDRDALREILIARLSALTRRRRCVELRVTHVSWPPALVDALADVIVHNYADMNGRGVDRVFETRVIDPLLDALDGSTRARGARPYATLAVQLALPRLPALPAIVNVEFAESVQTHNEL